MSVQDIIYKQQWIYVEKKKEVKLRAAQLSSDSQLLGHLETQGALWTSKHEVATNTMKTTHDAGPCMHVHGLYVCLQI